MVVCGEVERAYQIKRARQQDDAQRHPVDRYHAAVVFFFFGKCDNVTRQYCLIGRPPDHFLALLA